MFESQPDVGLSTVRSIQLGGSDHDARSFPFASVSGSVRRRHYLFPVWKHSTEDMYPIRIVSPGVTRQT